MNERLLPLLRRQGRPRSICLAQQAPHSMLSSGTQKHLLQRAGPSELHRLLLLHRGSDRGIWLGRHTRQDCRHHSWANDWTVWLGRWWGKAGLARTKKMLGRWASRQRGSHRHCRSSRGAGCDRGLGHGLLGEQCKVQGAGPWLHHILQQPYRTKDAEAQS